MDDSLRREYTPNSYAERDQALWALSALIANPSIKTSARTLYEEELAPAVDAYTKARGVFLVARPLWKSAVSQLEAVRERSERYFRRFSSSIRDSEGRSTSHLQRDMLRGKNPSEVNNLGDANFLAVLTDYAAQLSGRSDLDVPTEGLTRLLEHLADLRTAVSARDEAARTRAQASAALDSAKETFDARYISYVGLLRRLLGADQLATLLPQFTRGRKGNDDEVDTVEFPAEDAEAQEEAPEGGE